MPPRRNLSALRNVVPPPSPGLGNLNMPVMDTVETVLNSVHVAREGKEFKFSSAEVKRLVGLTYPNGAAVLSLANRNNIYEVVGACILLNTTTILTFLETILAEMATDYVAKYKLAEENKTTFDAKVQPINLVFSMPTFNTEKNRYLADMDRARRAISVMVGVVACPKCHSKNTVSVQLQTRSADEPLTNITTCHACGKTTRES